MKTKRKQAFFTIIYTIAFLLGVLPEGNSQKPVADNNNEKICIVSSISMNKICREWDGQWQGNAVASDGACYFATSTHSTSHGAGFHKYEPDSKKHTILAEDMTRICGEEHTLSQQGKIHSPIVECEGWLYFTTHLSNYWPAGIERYTGAHVIGYQLATGIFRDFGVVRPRYSIYSAINVDPVRKKIYVFVAPFLDELTKSDGCHLYSIDIVTGDKKDLGLITKNQEGACFWFYVDNNGKCWFTLWKKWHKYENDHGNLYCYNPNEDKIVTYKDVLPKGKYIDGTPVKDEKLLKERAWTWAQALPGNNKCLFTMGTWGGGDERLWIFDPSRDIKSGDAFHDIAFIGSTFLQTALGGDRIYFVQDADLDNERYGSAEAARERDPDIVGYDESLHLRSVSIVPDVDKTITDHGKIVDQHGRAARMINSLSADNKGRVYIMGSWYVKSLKEASFQIMIYDYPGQDIYKLVKRGEFFATVDVSKDN